MHPTQTQTRFDFAYRGFLAQRYSSPFILIVFPAFLQRSPGLTAAFAGIADVVAARRAMAAITDAFLPRVITALFTIPPKGLSDSIGKILKVEGSKFAQRTSTGSEEFAEN
jgi:hypothetical protein